jgi:RNA polymerase sigma-70 factor (ECF subfamily)
VLEALVLQHLDFVWRLLRRLGLDAADAEDATQQVLLIAADKIGGVAPGKERTYLYGIALRVAANARRGEQRRRRAHDRNQSLCEARETPSRLVPWPDDLAEQARARELLDELLARLPEELSRVLVLAEIEQCSLPEVAELEAIPVGTATSRLRRARASFSKLLAAEQHRNPFARGAG